MLPRQTGGRRAGHTVHAHRGRVNVGRGMVVDGGRVSSSRRRGGRDMRRRWNVSVIVLAMAAASHLSAGPGEVEGKVPGETGGRYHGSRIAAGPGAFGNHTCLVKEDATVHCWGSNDSGQLGNGSGGPGQFETSPVRVTNLFGAISVAAGSSHTCALRADGTVVCWGSNGSGQLGNGTTTPQP